MRRTRKTAIGLLLVSIAATCWGTDSSGKSLAVASGTKVRVAIIQRTKLKAGEPIQSRVMEPIYVENQLAIPAGALLPPYRFYIAVSLSLLSMECHSPGGRRLFARNGIACNAATGCCDCHQLRAIFKRSSHRSPDRAPQGLQNRRHDR